METIFPPSGNYQIGTLVNGTPIEDCSIIRSGDKIRPYFAVPVVDDPDLIGLLVYFQNSQGKIAGGKIRYAIRPDAEEITQPETEAREEIKPDGTDDAVSEDDEASETEIVGKGTWSFTNNKPSVEEITEVEIAVRSFAQDLPYFPLPVNLEIGSYTLVFEAMGNRETLSHTEISIFYLGNAEFNIKDIAMYLPGLSGSQLISPGTTVMLETRIDFDTRLDPYIVWYNGRNIIGEGKISDGMGNLLWTAPEQAGFYSLRLEAFPFLPKSDVTGVYREITLPVSPKAMDMGYFFRFDSKNISSPVPLLPPELLQWYQFEGSLDSSMPLSGDKQSLLPVDDKRTLRWTGTGQTYGLSAGSGDMYQVPPVHFFQNKQDQGGGIFLSHISLPAEGTILSAFFPLESSSGDGAWVEMISEGNIVALILSTVGTTVEMQVYLDIFELQGFIPVVIEFYIRPYRLEAKITLGEGLKSNAGSITLPFALSGEGRVRLGEQARFVRKNVPAIAAATPTKPATTAEDEGEDLLEVVETLSLWTGNRDTNTIWDEFAILLSTVPLFPEEFFEESLVEAVPGKESATVITETPAVYVQPENIVPETADEETGGDENLLSPVADTDADDTVQEPEMLSVLSEDS